METNVEEIKDIAVKVVESFINDKVPMSEGIAKQASELQLNPDQIKRVVETCNTITYLKLQKEASDRTFEFPVADYNSVMINMTLPTKPDSTIIEAEAEQGVVKQAEELAYIPDTQTMKAWSVTERFRNKAELEKLAYDNEACVQNIGDLALVMRKDELALEKLAEVTDQETFDKLVTLISPKRELVSHVFKEAELSDAIQLVHLYKEAQRIVSETAERLNLEKRAVEMAKSGGLGSGIGGVMGSVAAGTASAIAGVTKGLGKSKVVHPLDLAGVALSPPKPAHNVWDNLQGTSKRF